MFGFGKKSAEPQKPERGRRSSDSKERRSQNLAQFGFLGVGDDGDVDNLMGDVGDDDLEEELAMLLDGKQPAPRRPKTSPTKTTAQSRSSADRKTAGSARNFDINLENDDEAVDDDDADLDDPELAAELGDILGIPTDTNSKLDSPMDDDEPVSSVAPTMTTEQLISLLNERLVLYEKAKAAADASADSAKSRRFARGLKTLKEMLPKAKAGRVIDEAAIPPAVSIGTMQNDKQPSEPSPNHSVPPPVPPKLTPSPSENNAKSVPANVNEFEKPLAQRHAGSVMDGDDLNMKLPEPLIPTPAVMEPTPMQNSSIHPPASLEEPAVLHNPVIEARLKDYKRAAVVLKRQGNIQEAVKYLKLSKALELAVKTGEAIDLNNYPSVEGESSDRNVQNVDTTAKGSEEGPPQNPVAPSAEIPEPIQSGVPDTPSDIFGAPPPPVTVLEALEQRLDKYKSEVEKATAASNSSKARRMGRIVKQYEEAITFFKKGKPVAFDELPTPPGFSPIPVPTAPSTMPVAHRPTSAAESPGIQRDSQPNPASPVLSSPEKKPKEDLTKSTEPGPSTNTGQSPSGSVSSVSRSGKPSTKLTLQEKQLQMITLRQQQFKEAALNAKQRGDINQAREFLRTAKGFDKLIEVAQGGLPVDMATLPIPPEAVMKLELEEADNFEVVSSSDCIMPTDNAAEIYGKLEEDLKKQLKTCMRTRDHFKSIGDVASANRFESMALESKRDLDALRLAMKKNGDVPKYHYENRIFSITECNTDVADDEIEINVIQGINYKVSNPSDVDTFVRVELPYPSADEAQSNKSQVVKDTNNPTYDATYKMNINRTARNFQRFVHRHGVKCEVWSKGGFLRGSTLIGTATVKLLPLETKCTLHDAFDVLEGRKVVGKLEVKLRIREPVLTKQITQKKEKWLSIDRV